MGPVRLKYYGLIWMTRRTYLILQAVALLLCLVLMAVGFLTALVLSQMPATGTDTLIARFVASLFWIGLAALLAESLETYLMLRKFARAEAEQQAKLAALDASGLAPPATHSTGVQLPDDRTAPNTQP